MSEFGVEGGPDNSVLPADETWFLNTLNYLRSNDLDFAVWPLVGFFGTAAGISGDTWALLNWNLDTNTNNGIFDGDDWRADAWASFVNDTSGVSGKVPDVSARWQMLNMDNGDVIQSVTQRERGDSDVGARKAMCPDGLRLIGLSNTQRRGLCTNANANNTSLGYTWDAAHTTVVVTSEQFVDTDWASGYTKFQCPASHYVVGYAMRGARVSSVICAKSSGVLGTSSSITVWFDQVDNRRDAGGGEYASGDRHGGCVRGEYMSGVAFTTRIFKTGTPDAILCRM